MEDKILEQELVSNQRFTYHAGLGPIIIARPTPALERKIAEERRKVYHTDLKDSSVLTSEEVSRILNERGVWSADDDERLAGLTTDSAELMTRLTALGYESPSLLYLAIIKAKGALTSQYGEDITPEISEALERVFDMDTELVHDDLKLLVTNSTNSDMHELISDVQGFVLQMEMLREFADVKVELGDLLETHTKFFGDTIEARGAQVERMARVFFCMRTPEGESLWDTLDDMWNEKPEIVAWCSSQLYYFEYGISDEYARALQTHGFMGRVTDTEDTSESSQGHPESNSDGELPESEPPSSSESEVPTT